MVTQDALELVDLQLVEHVRGEPEAQRRRILSRSARGLIPYVAATALAVVSPYLTLAICALL